MLQILLEFSDGTHLSRTLHKSLLELIYALACSRDVDKIAGASVSHSSIRESIIQNIGLLVAKECEAISRKKDFTSLLRQTKPEQLISFTLDKLYAELLHHAPTLMKFLEFALTTKRKLDLQSHSSCERKEHVAEILSAAIVLKSQDKDLSALHHLLSLCLYRGGTSKQAMTQMSKLGLCTTRTALLGKLEQISQESDGAVLRWKSSVETYLRGKF